MEENKNSIILHTKNKTITLTTTDFDDEVDVDELTKIDYTNIYAETITVSALLNKVGLLKAEAQNNFSHKKVEFAIFEAELDRLIRQKAKSNEEKITEKVVEQRIILDPAWKIQKRNLINAERDLQFIESLYWAIQSKDTKLNVLCKGVIPEEHEHELIEGKINSVYIKARDRKFKES